MPRKGERASPKAKDALDAGRREAWTANLGSRLDDLLPKKAERVPALMAELLEGTPDQRETGQVGRLASLDLHCDRLEVKLERSLDQTSAKAVTNSDNLTRLLTVREKLHERLEETSRARVARASREHQDLRIGYLKPDPDKALPVLLMLLKQGALPNSSAEARQLAAQLSDQLAADRRNQAAVAAELADLPTTTNPKGTTNDDR